MRDRDRERLHTRIDRKLARVARSSPVPPVWQEPWSRLGPDSTAEDRLRICQTIRDSGTLPADAGYFLVCRQADHMAAAVLDKLRDPIQTLNMFEAMRVSDRILAELLDTHQEGPMAELFRSDPDEHARRYEAGRQFFFGSLEPEVPAEPGWLDALLRLVADSVVASEPVASLAFRCRRDGDSWEIHVGRPAVADQGWAVDFERLRKQFDRIDSLGWYAVPAGWEDGPYAWVEGKFLDREVFVRILVDAIHGTKATPAGEIWRRTP